ncbi:MULTISPECIES: SIS domain-containing protein [unclassified Gilliamella]|uniref:SIS domain-containing protein n=1 Tax=unclassified Gilliamella TaxID=2685620 RepID=UPI00080E435A|nr:SIS domain-containing protein [Gilliamella apicola]OCG17912.1 phosphoheptose isomerase [Gilliamella apicola]OCG23789.1 phosphoheptose isomerase [Gilliamella apicola]OCG26751.1 phosphoheptose isomerase [Gilliamella apicola]OCG36105.1 phosphoheptose isomerase [Gilliamella apicola]OCG59566.1 phosphoheptose isomerase [Gilliamella apicola]
MQDLIKNYFTESIQTQIVMAESLGYSIEKAANIIVESLLNGNKIMSCGNGPSAANVQSFTSRLITSINIERPSIPAIALVSDNVLLSAIANHEEIYARQIQALGQQSDVLIIATCQGNSRAIIRAVQEAVIKDMKIVALTAFDGGEVIGLLGQNDIEIRVPSYNKVMAYEMHAMILNCLCQLIENTLFIHSE